MLVAFQAKEEDPEINEEQITAEVKKEVKTEVVKEEPSSASGVFVFRKIIIKFKSQHSPNENQKITNQNNPKWISQSQN